MLLRAAPAPSAEQRIVAACLLFCRTCPHFQPNIYPSDMGGIARPWLRRALARARDARRAPGAVPPTRAQYLAHTFTCADARPNARRGDGARRAACVAGLLPVGRRTPTGARQRWGTALKLVPAHVLAYFNAVAGRFWDYEPSPRSVATAAAAARGTGPVKGGRARGMAARFAYSCPYLRT